MKATVSGVNVAPPRRDGAEQGTKASPARSAISSVDRSPAPETIPLSAVCAVCCLQARRGRLAWAA